jgi:hypothetical protein
VRSAWFLVLWFVAPYVVYASNTGQFRWLALARLAMPVAAVVLHGYFDSIFTSPFGGLHVEMCS